MERDRAAEERDREADQHDAEVARLTAGFGAERAITGAQVILRPPREREHAAEDRKRAAAHRAHAARDREQAARDRQRAAEDRIHAAAERQVAAFDALTGAVCRGPGLVELQREIDRARRGATPLVVAYVDIDGLKETNDSRGHAAGDALLKSVVGAMRARLRSYEPTIRLGGDEFLCALSGATIENARRRFDEIASELAARPEHGSVTVGFAELAPDDSLTDLIDRADTDLLAARGPRRAAVRAAS